VLVEALNAAQSINYVKCPSDLIVIVVLIEEKNNARNVRA